MVQKASRWRSDWAMAASVTRPLSMASSRSAVKAPGSGSASSARTYHGEADSSGERTPAWRIGELQRQGGDEFEGDDAVAAHLAAQQRQEVDGGLRGRVRR